MLRLASTAVSLRLRINSYSSATLYDQIGKLLPLSGKIRMTTTSSLPVQSDISNRLTEVFQPLHMTIENESYKHSVPKGSETHFKVVIVSEKFDGIPLIEQHRLVNDALQQNLQNGVHALAIKTMTPKKWASLQESNPSATQFTTPNCMGGSKHDKK